MGLDHVLSDLEGENYSCQAFIIPACAVNAPHRRDRVWIIAYAPSNGSYRNDQAGCNEREIPPDRLQPRHRWTSGIEGLFESFPNGKRWGAKPGICRLANGVPGRVDRLKQLGNAVVPQIVEIIGTGILQNE